jgi:very-short-patch-repair endonuclease
VKTGFPVAPSSGVAKKSHIDQQIGYETSRWGHIRQDELRRLGLSRSAISVRCRTGKLIAVFRGVYAVGHVQRTPAARADAAVMACGDRAALSHDSAAALYDLRKWPHVPEVSSALRFRIAGIRAHRTATLTRGDITVRRGIRVTTTARTIADIAPRLTDEQLTRVIHEARRNHHLADHGLRRLLNACPRAVELVDPGQPPSESALEDAFRVFLRRRDLPEPEFQVDWHGHRVDALYRDHKLIIELDGRRDHGQWDRIERDHVRDALAIEYHHDTLRITWRRLHKEADELERQLRAILAAREPRARR